MPDGLPSGPRHDDGGYCGGSTDCPNLRRLLEDVRARKIDVIVVYKVDRLTRSLADFAKLVELFDAHGVSFVSVTQQLNTTTSMGRYSLDNEIIEWLERREPHSRGGAGQDNLARAPFPNPLDSPQR
jgi:DNA invertase Pin-like site-specific DNA recombinase